jgi:hypothetical protein
MTELITFCCFRLVRTALLQQTACQLSQMVSHLQETRNGINWRHVLLFTFGDSIMVMIALTLPFAHQSAPLWIPDQCTAVQSCLPLDSSFAKCAFTLKLRTSLWLQLRPVQVPQHQPGQCFNQQAVQLQQHGNDHRWQAPAVLQQESL